MNSPGLAPAGYFFFEKPVTVFRIARSSEIDENGARRSCSSACCLSERFRQYDKRSRHWTQEKCKPEQVPSDAELNNTKSKAYQTDSGNNLPNRPTPLANTLDLGVRFEQQDQSLNVVPLRL